MEDVWGDTFEGEFLISSLVCEVFGDLMLLELCMLVVVDVNDGIENLCGL